TTTSRRPDLLFSGTVALLRLLGPRWSGKWGAVGCRRFAVREAVPLSVASDADESAAPRRQFVQPRVAQMVADVLRTRIVDGELPDGSLLPKQDDLIDEFQVSRPSFREALRILESEGLI